MDTSMLDVVQTIPWWLIIVFFLGLLFKLLSEFLQSHAARTRYYNAQNRIAEYFNSLSSLRSSDEAGAQQPGGAALLTKPAQKPLPAPADLFELYATQIERYQSDTQQRATISFIAAIVAMFAGIGFVIWAGVYALRSDSVLHTIGASAISTVGAALSAYITKTFSDLHRVSLEQLNRYFRQPVLNQHVLTVERLAEQLDENAKQATYVRLVDKVMSLMTDANLTDASKVTPPPDTGQPTPKS